MRVRKKMANPQKYGTKLDAQLLASRAGIEIVGAKQDAKLWNTPGVFAHRQWSGAEFRGLFEIAVIGDFLLVSCNLESLR